MFSFFFGFALATIVHRRSFDGFRSPRGRSRPPQRLESERVGAGDIEPPVRSPEESRELGTRGRAVAGAAAAAALCCDGSVEGGRSPGVGTGPRPEAPLFRAERGERGAG